MARISLFVIVNFAIIAHLGCHYPRKRHLSHRPPLVVDLRDLPQGKGLEQVQQAMAITITTDVLNCSFYQYSFVNKSLVFLSHPFFSTSIH